jgi:D-alanyl-D-alanine endopeptidase (penicillin-binding protein 7)
MCKWFITLFALIANTSAFSIEIDAKSWAIADGDGNVIDQQNINSVQPIASITKLMTVMVVLDTNESLKEVVTMSKFKGTVVTRRQLIDLAIVHSDNDAAKLLCKIYHRGYDACIADMNHKARVLGMSDTEFFDSSGLDNRNVSNALDLIKLLRAAEKYPLIVNASNQTVVELVRKKQNGVLRTLILWLQNTMLL